MQTLETGAERWSPDAGVSLIEALITLAIIGMIAGMVVLAAPAPDRPLRNAAERLAARLSYAGDQSVITNRTFALQVRDGGYEFLRLEADGWREARDDAAFRFTVFPDGIDMKVEDLRDSRQPVHAAEFTPIGDVTPRTFVLSGAGARWRVKLDSAGAVNAQRVD